ncbi:MAG TPA: hypothetical protein VK898_20530, partial [Chloroflexota bacterium]|nr:hypothetical protein [Chloroflexota bacterium]
MKMVIPGQAPTSDVARNGSRPRPRNLRPGFRRPRHLVRWAVVLLGLIVVVAVVLRQMATTAAPTSPAPQVASSGGRLI